MLSTSASARMRLCQSWAIEAPAAVAAARARGFPGSLSRARVASCHARQASPFASFCSLFSDNFEVPAQPTTNDIAKRTGASLRNMLCPPFVLCVSEGDGRMKRVTQTGFEGHPDATESAGPAHNSRPQQKYGGPGSMVDLTL